MKNRRIVLMAFLLCACMIVGVGYAAVTDVLDISGSADVNRSAAENAFNVDVYFSETVVIGDFTVNGELNPSVSTPNTSSRVGDNNDKVTFTVNTLQGAGDTATFTYTILNDGDVEAVVTPSISSNTNPEYFSVTSDWNGQSKTLEAAENDEPATLTYTVTVTLLQTPTDTISGSVIIELTAVSADADLDAGDQG